MAAPKKAAAPKKEYVHVVMAKHPLTGKDMPITEPYAEEQKAYEEAARRNKNASHLQHHVKKIEKGSSGRKT